MIEEALFIDAHTHLAKVGNHVSIFNIIVKSEFTDGHEFAKFSTESHPNLRFSVGIHPWFIDDWPTQLSRLKALAANPRVIAIGECGLDKTIAKPIKEQVELFEFQIKLSEELHKPLIIHCVKSYNEILKIRNTCKATMPWVLHGFTGSLEIATQCVKAGLILSFGKSIFQANSHSAEVLKSLDNTVFLLETDESDFSIEGVYNQCAVIKNSTTEVLQSTVAKNFHRIFNC